MLIPKDTYAGRNQVEFAFSHRLLVFRMYVLSAFRLFGFLCVHEHDDDQY